MAKAVGVTTQELDKMLERGEVFAADALPNFGKELRNFARQNDALSKSLGGINFATGNLANTMREFREELFQAGLGQAIIDLFNQVSMSLQDLKPLGRALGRIVGGFVDILTFAIRAITAPLSLLGEGLDMITESVGKLNIIFAGLAGVGIVRVIMGIRSAIMTLVTGGTIAGLGTLTGAVGSFAAISKTAFGAAAVRAVTGMRVALTGLLATATKLVLPFVAIAGVADEILSLFREGDAKKVGVLTSFEGDDRTVGERIREARLTPEERAERAAVRATQPRSLVGYLEQIAEQQKASQQSQSMMSPVPRTEFISRGEGMQRLQQGTGTRAPETPRRSSFTIFAEMDGEMFEQRIKSVSQDQIDNTLFTD